MKEDSIQYQTASIISNQEIAPGNFVLELECPVISANARPGQFAMLKPHSGGRTLLGRPLSFLKRDSLKVEFFYKICGKGTTDLSRLKFGDLLNIWGPLGNGFQVPQSKEWCFVAGGMGIAPLVFLAQEYSSQAQIRVFLGVKNKAQIVFQDLLKNSGCDVIYVTEDGSAGKKGFVTIHFEEFLKSRKSQDSIEIFSCGPKPMEAEVARIAQERNIPCQLALEEYMGCGMGTCMGCVVKYRNGQDWVYKRVCKEGPVFRAEQIIWEN